MARDPTNDPVMALPPEQRIQAWADRAWPLRFTFISFQAACWSTQRCSIRFCRHEHGSLGERFIDGAYRLTDEPSGPPPRPDWHEHVITSFPVSPSDHGGKIFPTPVDINWTSLDGTDHSTPIDLEAIFPDRRLLHDVPKDDIPVPWLAAQGHGKRRSAEVLVEVNDRTVNVYMRGLVATISPNPKYPWSTSRNEHVLAWSRTY